MGEKLCREQGADAVALAGTDMFLAFDGVACGYDVIDCARVHIEDIVARALREEAGWCDERTDTFTFGSVLYEMPSAREAARLTGS